MPAIIIDGPNKIIDIGFDAGTTIVTAPAIYSAWKDWVLAGNAQYQPAFSDSVGGNDLGGGVNLDAYYFIRNDLGWRIRAADTDHTLVLEGQLFGFASATAVFLPRAGRTIQYQTVLSSRSQVVNPAADAVQASGSYAGRVYLDPTSAFADTDFPTGTSVQPVNNMVSAVQIANQYNIREIYLLGSITLTEDVAGFTISNADKGIQVTVQSAANVWNTLFDGVNVTGYFDGLAFIRNGVIDSIIEGFTGHIDDCHISTGITCSGNVNIMNCASDVPGAGNPYIDLDGLPVGVQIRDWHGGIEVRGMTAGCNVSLDVSSGRVVIDSSCTGGFIKVRGLGEPIEDNSGGAVTLDDNGFLAASEIKETGQEILLIEKILRNRRETNPVTGVQRIYDDDGTTVLLEGDVYEDVNATQPYRGQGADRVDRLETP